ncbi:hypothetical protein ACUN0C_01555 [Faunimonas sp. B44]|uniref:hypothetical protein n=1 Tax=Faunimonas sp. B44 TaxID=3461493 RepID=UPI004044D75A
MLRFIARLLGIWLIAAALVSAVVDAAKSIAASTLVATPLGQIWFQVAPGSFTGAENALVNDYSMAWLWTAIAEWVLPAPAWLVFVLLGAVLLRLGRPKRRHRFDEESEFYA